MMAATPAMRLQLLPVPVSDVERAKRFYMEQAGFVLDHDVQPGDGVRVVQLTPPGSACSILLGEGLPNIEMETGCLRGVHLVVDDIETTRAALLDRGLEIGPVQDMGGILYAGFSDPDGNTWTLQEIPEQYR